MNQKTNQGALYWIPVITRNRGDDCLYIDELPGFLVPFTAPTANDELAELVLLSDNWDGQGAPAPKTGSLEFASQILKAGREYGLQPLSVSPSAIGGVGITYAAGTREVFVEARNVGRIYSLFSEANGDDPEFLRVEIGEINEYFNRVSQYLHADPIAPVYDNICFESIT